MSLYQIIVGAWIVDVVLQFILTRRLLSPANSTKPLFKIFIRFDFCRAAGMLLIWWLIPKWYAWGFVLTEVPDAFFIGTAAVEAGREIEDRWFPVVMLASVLLILLFPSVHPNPGSPWMSSLFMVRFVACGSAWSAILTTSIWARRTTLHAAILFIFCLVDTMTYLALLRGGPGAHDTANAFVLIAQCGCIATWIWATGRPIPGQDPDHAPVPAPAPSPQVT